MLGRMMFMISGAIIPLNRLLSGIHLLSSIHMLESPAWHSPAIHRGDRWCCLHHGFSHGLRDIGG
jgi:hypothetical protein